MVWMLFNYSFFATFETSTLACTRAATVAQLSTGATGPVCVERRNSAAN